MTKLFPALFFVLSSAGLAARAGEIWLTPQRAAELRRVTSRPYVVSQERIGADTVVYRWTNGLHGAVTTQRVQQVLGKSAKSAWQDKIDAKEREKQTILDDIPALGKKAKVTPSEINAVADRHDPGRSERKAGGK